VYIEFNPDPEAIMLRELLEVEPALARALAHAVASCEVLSGDDARHFVENGFVVIRDAFPLSIAEHVRTETWHELSDRFGITEDDPTSWDSKRAGPQAVPGHMRTAGSGHRFNLQATAPRALAAQLDVVGGAERLAGGGEKVAWGDAAAVNLGGASAHFEVPDPRLSGWHKDGWHFRHFLGSPEQGLLTVPIFSEIRPGGGGTVIATDSIAPVARLLAAHPEGLHPDSVQGAGYLIPGLIDRCKNFVELTGDPGDMVLLHPYMLHRASAKVSGPPRFIANAALALREPMRFDRNEDDPYSLVEIAVLRALGKPRLPFTQTRPALACKPTPFREKAESAEARRWLELEMRQLAEAGEVTPNWATDYGYMTNALDK
jgi:hypothetical protein